MIRKYTDLELQVERNPEGQDRASQKPGSSRYNLGFRVLRELR